MTPKRIAHLCIWILLALVLLAGTDPDTRAGGPDEVAVVIQFADGTVSTYCVGLPAAQITGLEALQRTGLDIVYQGGAFGAQVCKIEDVGCDLPGDCFCQCKGQECLYWSYWHLVDGAWQYAIAGAGSYQVTGGGVEGWSWGIGTPNSAPQPPLISFAEVCAAPTATVGATSTPSPTASPTQTEAPTSTPTVRPTGTVGSTGTAGATVTATGTPTRAAASEPSPTPTQPAPTPTPSPSPAQATVEPPVATALSTVTPVPEPTPTAPVSTSYILFGAILLVLLALGAYVLLRRR